MGLEWIIGFKYVGNRFRYSSMKSRNAKGMGSVWVSDRNGYGMELKLGMGKKVSSRHWNLQGMGSKWEKNGFEMWKEWVQHQNGFGMGLGRQWVLFLLQTLRGQRFRSPIGMFLLLFARLDPFRRCRLPRSVVAAVPRLFLMWCIMLDAHFFPPFLLPISQAVSSFLCSLSHARLFSFLFLSFYIFFSFCWFCLRSEKKYNDLSL